MLKPRSVSVIFGRVVVVTAAHGLSVTCIGMWHSFTWLNCGGVQCGRERHRIVWIMFGGAHDVPWDVKSASLEQFVPPWTV